MYIYINGFYINFLELLEKIIKYVVRYVEGFYEIFKVKL